MTTLTIFLAVCLLDFLFLLFLVFRKKPSSYIATEYDWFDEEEDLKAARQLLKDLEKKPPESFL